MAPGQLCNDLLHKLLVGVRLSESSHIFQVSRLKSPHSGERFPLVLPISAMSHVSNKPYFVYLV
jgi:hypothetical protein